MKDVRFFANHPVQWIKEFLDVKLWKKQQQIAESVVNHKRTAVRSCHGSGKTFLAAQVALWWLFTRPYSTVLTTAPTGRQVNELLWKEIRKSYGRAGHLGGDLLPKASKLSVDDDWLCIGFSTDDPVNFQGWHSPGGILAIFDEAPGIHRDIWTVTKSALVTERDRLLCIGNPVEPSGPFFDMFKDPDVGRFHISAFDVPNVDTGQEIIPGLCTRGWVEERRREWGEGTPMWKSRVMGDFPDDADDSLIPLSWIEKANTRWQAKRNSVPVWGVPSYGVDVARFGEDSSVSAPYHPDVRCVAQLERFPKLSTMETAGRVITMARESNESDFRIDGDGLGAGVYDRVAEEIGARAVEMRGGMSPRDKAKFVNRRAEWYWNLRTLLDPKGDTPIGLPPDERLASQLTSIRWAQNSRGLIKIESKDEMRKRGMKSPDEADAVAMAVAEVYSKPQFAFA